MNIDAIHGFIKGLEAHFSPPRHATSEASKAWLTMMVNALHGSSPEVLNRARIRIVETRANRYFPLVAEIRKACREAAEELNFNQHVETLPTLRETTDHEWSTERVKLAYDLLKTELGRRAANEGWVLSYWNFIRKNQRVPSGHEIETCKKQAKDFDEAYAQCVRGGWPLARAMVKLGDGMLERRDKLRAEALGK